MIDLIILDSTLISASRQDSLEELENLCHGLQARGIKLAVVSTNNMGMYKANRRNFKVNVNYTLSGEDVFHSQNNPFKGGGRRITDVCEYLGIAAHRTLYIGDDRHDYASALHAGCFFVLAGWLTRMSDFAAVYAERPKDVWRFISHYLLPEPRWAFQLDDDTRKFRFRSLLSANTLGNNETRLTGNPPYGEFNLIQLLKDQRPIFVGDYAAENVLFLHTISSLVLEGICPIHSIFTVYPSSTKMRQNKVVNSMVGLSSRLLGQNFLTDLILRGKDAPKSREQKLAGQDSFLTQANTVHLNPSHRQKIQGRDIVVFDDFHTSGKSLDWARNLLISGGAKSVILVTPGKFGGASKPHEAHDFKDRSRIRPYELTDYSTDDYTVRSLRLNVSRTHASTISSSFALLRRDLPLEAL